MRLGSLGEAAAFQLSERETLAKVELVPHFLGTSWGGPPTAFRVPGKQESLVYKQPDEARQVYVLLRSVSQTGRRQVAIPPLLFHVRKERHTG